MKVNIDEVCKTLGFDSIEEAMQDCMFGYQAGNPSICLSCGTEGPRLEPDAYNVRCDACGADKVIALESLILWYS